MRTSERRRCRAVPVECPRCAQAGWKAHRLGSDHDRRCAVDEGVEPLHPVQAQIRLFDLRTGRRGDGPFGRASRRAQSDP